ncbi:MAG: hypothetical protein AB1498_03845 [bacterium]
MKKNFMLALVLILVAGFYSVSFAGISTTPHDVVSWHNTNQLGTRVNTGVCSYCHIPHSAKGDRLFPIAVASETAGVGKSKLGIVAFLCAQCHSSIDNDFNAAHLDPANEMIFRALPKPNRAADTTTYDTHPTIYTSAYINDTTLGIADSTSTTAISVKWPYYDDWLQGKRDIECSSCHNPHDWNQGNRRNYLRVAYFDSSASEYSSTYNSNFRNVCSFCHTGRDKSGVGTSNEGSHPVGNVVADPNSFAMGSGYEGIWLDSLNCDPDTTGTRFFKKYKDTTGVSGSKAGKAVGDRGAHLGPAGEFTCMSCHMPHAAPNSQDGVTSANDTLGLVMGPLLVKDNDETGYSSANVDVFQDAYSKWQGETAFIIDEGESNACEWCHGITPKKTDTVETYDQDTIKKKYAHPVNNYPTSTADNTTRAYISNLADEIYSSTNISLRIRYPVHADSTSTGWKNYEESGAPNIYTMGNARGQGDYLICNSCHDVHLGQVGTPILRGPSSVQYCEDCHYENPLPAGTSHPINNLKGAQVCDLTTEDGIALPNYAKLPLLGTSSELMCRTCHGGAFGTGVIHGGMGRFMLADYIDFAELCVNCHGWMDTGAVTLSTTYSKGLLDTLRVGTAKQKAANPSYWYLEGPNPVWAHKDPNETNGTDRLGSHYIGVISNNRPYLSNATYGWLGSSDTTLDHRGEIENTTDVDNWLDTTWFGGWPGRRMWTNATDGVGVDQYSIVGYLYATVTTPVVTCLSCHTPHGAATGGATGNGPVDDTTEDNQWSGELLLAKNTGSYICYICHFPAATHPVEFPGTTHVGHKVITDTASAQYNPLNPSNKHDWVTRTDTTINLFDTADPKKVVRESTAIFKPANYPYGQMVCESCHSAHSANSRWGSYILEGDTTRAFVEVYSSAWTAIDTGYYNKRPVNNHTQHDTVKSVNDRPTCEMCHPQGE